MRFKPNPRFEREIDRQASVRLHIRKKAMQVKSFAVGMAPRGVSDDYAASIDVVDRGDETYVRTNDFAGHMVEYGSVNNPPYAPIRRAIRAAGLRLDEKRK